MATIDNIGFSQFKIRLWNYYSNYNLTNIVMLRLSVYNPQFYMPSLTTLPIQLNFPPSGCQISVQPSSGIAILTPFKVSIANCFDEDAPLAYRYQFYTSNYLMQQDVVQGNTLSLNSLTDFSQDENSFIVQLPMSDEADYEQDIKKMLAGGANSAVG